jgi:hypothetical protein
MDLDFQYFDQQQALCKKYDAPFFEAPTRLKVGIARNVKDGIQLINGLRHPPEGDTSGWYIWRVRYYPKPLTFSCPCTLDISKIGTLPCLNI